MSKTFYSSRKTIESPTAKVFIPSENACTISSLRKNWIFARNDDGNYTIKKYRGGAKNVVVPQSIGKRKVTRIDKRCFANSSSPFLITSITIPGSIKILPKNLFAGCSGLKSVLIEKGVQKIDDFVFSGCVKLERVFLPESVTQISAKAFASYKDYREGVDFKSATNLSYVKLPIKVFEKGYFSFEDCEHINSTKSITLVTDATFACVFDGTKELLLDCINELGGKENNQLVIYAPMGSDSAEFATENNIKFIATPNHQSIEVACKNDALDKIKFLVSKYPLPWQFFDEAYLKFAKKVSATNCTEFLINTKNDLLDSGNDEELEKIQLSTLIVGMGDFFLFRAHDDSMTKSKIEKGDLVIVDKTNQNSHRKILAYKDKEKQIIFRKIKHIGSDAYLIADSGCTDATLVTTETMLEISFIGYAVSVIKQLKSKALLSLNVCENEDLIDFVSNNINATDTLNLNDIKKIHIPVSFYGTGEFYLFCVMDRYMMKFGIDYCDSVIIKRTTKIKNEDIVAVRCSSDGRTSLRKIKYTENGLYLVSGDDNIEAISIINNKKINIIGVAVAVIKPLC